MAAIPGTTIANRIINWTLVCDNVRLGWAHAIKCAKKAGLSSQSSSEAVESLATAKCLDVLIECSRYWDPAFGVKFSTYACRALSRGVKPRDCFLSPPLRRAFDDNIPAPVGHVPCEITERKETLHALFATLEEKDHLVLLMRYWRGMTYRQIGAAFGCSPATGQNRVRKALKTAKVRLKEKPRA